MFTSAHSEAAASSDHGLAWLPKVCTASNADEARLGAPLSARPTLRVPVCLQWRFRGAQRNAQLHAH